jgi:hypothetical protein
MRQTGCQGEAVTPQRNESYRTLPCSPRVDNVFGPPAWYRYHKIYIYSEVPGFPRFGENKVWWVAEHAYTHTCTGTGWAKCSGGVDAGKAKIYIYRVQGSRGYLKYFWNLGTGASTVRYGIISLGIDTRIYVQKRSLSCAHELQHN